MAEGKTELKNGVRHEAQRGENVESDNEQNEQMVVSPASHVNIRNTAERKEEESSLGWVWSAQL